jgi:hypothetical protein
MQFTTIRRGQPRFINDADSATMTNYYRVRDGANWVTDATATMSNNRFALLRSSRWHKFKFDFAGNVEINGASYHLMPGGYE